MRTLLPVAAGGALGAVARHLVYLAAAAHPGGGFPVATLTVNVLGSFAMGVLVTGAALLWTLGPRLRSFLVVGFLGGFTTFSAFAHDVVTLHQSGSPLSLSLYIAASVACSIAGLYLGMWTVRRAAGARAKQ
ncbi:MAG: fluoride efflux transporter CrcB [Kiloniellales bacterium]|nr:fluoride efflux transporter CrcB [Kiloniellales bacterium]